MSDFKKTFTINYDATIGNTTFDLNNLINPAAPAQTLLGSQPRLKIQLNYSDLNVSTSTVELFRSEDGVNYVAVPGTLLQLDSGANQVNDWNLSNNNSSFYQIRYVQGGGISAGTLDEIIVILNN